MWGGTWSEFKSWTTPLCRSLFWTISDKFPVACMATTVERKERRRATYGGEQGLGARRRPSRSASEYSTKNLHDIVFDEKENDPTLPDSSLWHDGPLFVAILPCLAAFVFGTEYIQDVILFLFVGWYLHTGCFCQQCHGPYTNYHDPDRCTSVYEQI